MSADRGPAPACVECGNDDPTEGYVLCLDCLEEVGEEYEAAGWPIELAEPATQDAVEG